ncbi:uncharacterized protein LOC111075493 [Drosophila obscura]|uniref:uncharacterized protein LOC111075493 n=1 Tax=Drosophila obscura TaxID=7282 RepID=UPI000BA0F74B|nr:uncharacterized protein LOC111075493 [Drosophila obscura]
MDKVQTKQLLMYRTPNEAHNQIFIFNSPIDYKDQQLIVYQRPGALYGEHGYGYCVVYKRDHYILNNPPNFQSPTKRSFLNECIRQLYLMNGMVHKLYWGTSSASLATPGELWHQVDSCLQPERITKKIESMKRVKRQLFREPRCGRKTTKPVRGKVWGTQVFSFRPMREKIGRRYIRRGFLRPARQTVLQQLICENLKREIICSPAVCKTVISAAEGIFNVNASVISDICSYHNNAARHQPAVECRLTAGQARLRNNEACRLTQRAKRLEEMFIHEQVRRAVQNHQLILEESVRSIFYAKELFRLIEDHEEFVYTDKQILGRH